jgi:hypothetical protein
MRRFLVIAFALLVAPGAVRADPSAPQITPVPGHREDAQRLRDQLRGLDHESAPRTADAPTPTPPAPAEPSPSNPARTAAVVLLTVAGAATLGTLGTVVSSPNTGDTSNYDTAATVLGITAVVTGAIGYVLLVKSRSVQVAPTVTPGAVGLAISGRL